MAEPVDRVKCATAVENSEGGSTTRQRTTGTSGYTGAVSGVRKVEIVARTGGKQVVVVQHVQVSGGGQAVIAGSMEAGRGDTDGGGR